MRKLIYILLLGTFFHSSRAAFAQTLNALWANAAGGTRSDQGRAIATDKAGNCVVVGTFQGTAVFDKTTLRSAGFDDIFIARFDVAGKLIWVKQAGGEDSERGLAVAIDGAGNIVITGFFEGVAAFDDISLNSTGGTSDIFVAKYDANGRVLWAKQAGESGSDTGNAVAVDETSSIIISGSFDGTITFGNTTFESNGAIDIFIAKYDARGNVLWAKQAGGSDLDEGYGVATDAANNIVVTGYFEGRARFDDEELRSSSGEDDDIFIAKYAAAGKLIWAKAAGGNGLDVASSIATDKLDVILTGTFQDVATFDTIRVTSSDFSEDIFIARYDQSGNALWAKSAGGPRFDDGLAIAVDDAGNSFITGYFGGEASFGNITLTSAGITDIFIAKYDAAGNLLEATKAGGVSEINEGTEDAGFGIATDGAGNVYATGVFYETATFGQIRLSSAGSDDIFIAQYGAVAPDISLNKASLDYSVVLIGKSAIDTLVASNSGNAVLNVSAIISGTNANEFAILSGGGTFDLSPGKSQNVLIRFAPTTAGNKSATLQLSTNDPDEKLINIALTGSANRPPVVANPIPNQIVTLGGAPFSRNLNAAPAVFADPDQDALTYTASSSDTNIARPRISGSTLTVSPVAAGSARITITANDNKGGTVSTTFTVTVNRPPVVANAIPNQIVTLGGAPFSRNLNATPIVFTDPDQDPITYAASSSATNITTVSISGSTLTVAAVAAGSATITVTANDNKGGTASTTFTVAVTLPAIPDPPSDLIVVAVSTRQINLQWRDNSTNEDGFRLERRVGVRDTVITVGANVTRYQDTSLRPGASASYQIRAFNAGGPSSITNVALATTATELRGDVIPDFRLNAQDVSRVVNIIFQSAANVTRLDSSVADCNAEFPDGKINVIDVIYIVNGSLGGSLATANEPARSSNTITTSGELIVGPGSASVGGTVNLPVTITAAEPVAVVQFKFRYDSRKITLGEPVLTTGKSSLKIAAARAADQLAVLVYNLSAHLLPAGQHELLQIPLRLEAGNVASNELQIESVLVVGEQGRVIPVLVRHEAVMLQTVLPERFGLNQNYPNPFSRHAASGNSATEIAYTLSVASPVRLSIYNLMGQEIAVLIDETQTAGNKKATWDGRDRAGAQVLSGVYFYRLQAGNFVATKKLLVIP